VTSQVPEAGPGDRIEITGVPEVPGLEVLRIDARSRLWRWYHDTYTVITGFDAFRTSWRYRARVYDGEPEMIVLMEPGEVHADVRKRQAREVWRVLLFPPALVEAAAWELGVAPSRAYWRRGMVVRPDLHARLAAVHAALEGEATPLERGAGVTAVLLELLRDHGEDQPRAPGPVTAGVRRARDLLHDRWNEDVRLDDLAAASGMGRFQVLRAFRGATGLPPHAYQLSLRVSRAMSLIRDGLPLAEVAVEAGFADQSHFTRRFSAVIGVSPARYRRGVC
jgi:AraC-like DNA-binding protein